MDGWSWALLIVAAYVAVVSLARFMIAKRDRLVDQFRTQLAAEKKKRPAPSDDKPKQDHAA